MEQVTMEGDHAKKDRSSDVTMVTMNLSGRFKAREIKMYGQGVLRHILVKPGVAVFFGQQMNFRPNLPENYVFEGGNRAFLYYDKHIFRGCDEKQYRYYLKDMENKGRIHRYYLPEANYVVVKLRGRATPRNKFLAISWMTDECQGKLKSLNLVRKLLSFAADLCAIEEMPVVVGGTFRITLEEAKNIVYTEFEGFRVFGYMATRPKRMLRTSNFFFTAKPVKMDGVRPLLCSKIEVQSGLSERWLNPEDAFYWDPVLAQVRLRRHGHSRPTSPPKPSQPPSLAAHASNRTTGRGGGGIRAEWTKLEPTLEQREPSVASDTWSDFTEMERKIKQEEEDTTPNLKAAISAPSLATRPPKPDFSSPLPDPKPLQPPEKHERTLQSVPDLEDPAVFERLEDTLRRLEDRRAGRRSAPNMAATSAQIQETLLKLSTEDAEDAEVRAINGHAPRQQDAPDSHAPEPAPPRTPHGFINPDEYDLSVEVSRKDERIPGFDTFGLKMELTRQEELDITLADATHLLQSISCDPPGQGRRVVEGASEPNLTYFRHLDAGPGSREDLLDSSGELDESGEPGSSMNGILRKIPSYIELYDEELLESNTLCYMQ